MKIKKGVRVFGVRPEVVLALFICEGVYREFQRECVITSVIDGRHSRGSKHYSGNAVDIRTRNLNPLDKEPVKDEIAARLGEDYDVVLERDHIHIEFDPKLPY